MTCPYACEADIPHVACPVHGLAAGGGPAVTTAARPAKGRRPKSPLPDGPPGRWEIAIPGHRPVSLNAASRDVKAKVWAKKLEREVLLPWLLHAGVTRATGKRRLALAVTGRGVLPDPDNMNKAFRDALVWWSALVGDAAEWLEATEPAVGPGEPRTVVTLEDV